MRLPEWRWGFMTAYRIGPVTNRLRLIETPLFGLYLHQLGGPDTEPDGHDHPWGLWCFYSLVLCGGYTETVWKDLSTPALCVRRRHRRGSIHHMPAKWAHRITEVHSHSPTWTLVLVGPKTRDWGWWKPQPDGSLVKVPWREYRKPEKSLAGKACEDAALWGN